MPIVVDASRLSADTFRTVVLQSIENRERGKKNLIRMVNAVFLYIPQTLKNMQLICSAAHRSSNCVCGLRICKKKEEEAE